MRSCGAAKLVSAIRWGGIVAVVSAICLGAGSSRAADPAKAETLIEEANALRSQGHDQRAIPLLKQAYDLAPSPRTAGQLGLAELAVGYSLEADKHLDEALAAPGHPWVKKNRAALEGAQRVARSQVATLTIDGQPDGAEIFANGQLLGHIPLPHVRVAEGRVSLLVRSHGFIDEVRELTLAGGTRTSVQFTLQAVKPAISATAPPSSPVASVAKPSTPTPPETSQSLSENVSAPSTPGDTTTLHRVLPASFAGVAAIALGYGIWQHVSWRDSQSSYESVDGCYAQLPMHGTDPRCAGLYTTLDAHRTHAYVAYGAAAIFAGAAAVAHWLTLPSSSTAVGPGPGAAGLSVVHLF